MIQGLAKEIEMKSVKVGSLLLSAILMGTIAFGQGVPPLPSGIDLSGAWFPLTHQDSGLGTAAGMIADWGGIPMNEAGRLKHRQDQTARNDSVQSDFGSL